jgi:cytochrome c5
MRNSVLSRAYFGVASRRATKLVALTLFAVTILAACTAEPEIEKPAVYASSCEPCHGNGGGGAPVTGDKEEWATRLAKGREAVYLLAIQGFESPVDDEGRTAVMPAKGARLDLSDDEIKALVDYMIAVSQ